MPQGVWFAVAQNRSCGSSGCLRWGVGWCFYVYSEPGIVSAYAHTHTQIGRLIDRSIDILTYIDR